MAVQNRIMFERGYKLQAAIARVLNLDERQLTRVVLDVAVDSAPRFRATGFLTAEQQEQFVRIFDAVAFEERS
jgi:Lhr-like helicase